MPSNIDLIVIHLEEMLRETGQAGNVKWEPVMGYCIGYYDKITVDHILAINELERRGLIIK